MNNITMNNNMNSTMNNICKDCANILCKNKEKLKDKCDRYLKPLVIVKQTRI